MPQGSPRQRPTLTTAVRTAALIPWLVVLASLTLSHQDPSQMDPSLPQLSTCLVCGDRGTSDSILNVLLFTPLGFLLHGRRWSVLRIAILAVLLSASIEAAQHFIPGRYSNLGDVVWNTTGATLGGWVWSVRAAWMPPSATRGGALGRAATLLAIGVTLAFGWLMAPDWPAEPYVGQWTPDLPYMDRYDGSVVEARLDTTGIPSGPFPEASHPRALLLADWTLAARAVKGPPPAGLAPILSVRDAHREEVTMLGASGDDLVYRERSRARPLRLDQPDLRVGSALARVGVGTAMTLAVRRRGRDRCLIVEGREACPGFTPGRAWSLLMYPVYASEAMRRWIDRLWMFALLLPVGLWSSGPRAAGIRGVVVAVGILVAVAATRLVLPLGGETLAAVLGLAGGLSARTALRFVSGGVVARASSSG